MARIRTLPPGSPDASAALEETYDEIHLSKPGKAHILEVQSLNPRALGTHHALYRALMFGRSPLSRAEREMVAVVVSATNGCEH